MSIQEVQARAIRATRGWGGVTMFALVAPMIGVFIARMIQPYASPAVAAAESPLATRADAGPQGEKTHTFRRMRSDEIAELDAMATGDIAGLSGTPLMKLAGEPSAASSRVEIIEDVPTLTPPPMGVSSIMATKTQPLAVVGGKLLRVGDEVCPGWKISGIDPDAGTVSLQHESGFVHTLNLRQ
jgi:hypothetical protein